jgi:hypothetical protein
MAKTIFENGTYILTEFLNAIFGGGAKSAWLPGTAYAAGKIIKLSGGEILRAVVGGVSDVSEPDAPATLRDTVVDNSVTWALFGGHQHDDLSIDGSAPKVLLTSAAEVSGTLPLANMSTHSHNGTQATKINLATAAEVTGVLPAANVDLSGKADTASIDAIVASGNFNATFPTNKVLTFYYQKRASGLVKVWWGDLTGMDSNNSQAASGYPVPVSIRPTVNRLMVCLNNGSRGAYIEFGTDSSINIYPMDNTTVFTALYGYVAEYLI